MKKPILTYIFIIIFVFINLQKSAYCLRPISRQNQTDIYEQVLPKGITIISEKTQQDVVLERIDYAYMEPGDFAYIILVNGEQVRPFAADTPAWSQMPVVANIFGKLQEDKGIFSVRLIDVGEYTNTGIGKAILKKFGQTAHDLNYKLEILHFSNLGVVRIITDMASMNCDLMIKQLLIEQSQKVFLEGLDDPSLKFGFYYIESKDDMPEFRILEGDEFSDYDFDEQKNPKVKKLTFEFAEYMHLITRESDDSNIPKGTSLNALTFNPDGTFSYNGKTIGYAIAINFFIDMQAFPNRITNIYSAVLQSA